MCDLHNAIADFDKDMYRRAVMLHEKAEMLAKLLSNLDSPGKDWQQSMNRQGEVVQIR